MQIRGKELPSFFFSFFFFFDCFLHVQCGSLASTLTFSLLPIFTFIFYFFLLLQLVHKNVRKELAIPCVCMPACLCYVCNHLRLSVAYLAWDRAAALLSFCGRAILR